MLTEGITGQQELLVSQNNTAIALKSGTMEVFATPAFVALAEETAWKSILNELEEGYTTVGTKLEVSHLSATPVGMKVICTTTLKEIDGKKLVFWVQAKDEIGLVGEGIHERYIVEVEKFMNRAKGKLEMKL